MPGTRRLKGDEGRLGKRGGGGPDSRSAKGATPHLQLVEHLAVSAALKNAGRTQQCF